jgi:hypothetical protein
VNVANVVKKNIPEPDEACSQAQNQTVDAGEEGMRILARMIAKRYRRDRDVL